MKKLVLFFIICITVSSTTGWSWPWTDNGLEGKTYVKYDNSGNHEYKMVFENGIIKIGPMIRQVLWYIPQLQERYEYNKKTKLGRIIIVQHEDGSNPRMETHFDFRVANDILILTTHKINGMDHQIWHDDIEKMGGTYVELK